MLFFHWLFGMNGTHGDTYFYIFSFLSFYLVTVAENHLQRPNIGNCIHFYYILYMPTKSFDGLQNFLNFLPFFNIATNEKKVLQMSPGMFWR